MILLETDTICIRVCKVVQDKNRGHGDNADDDDRDGDYAAASGTRLKKWCIDLSDFDTKSYSTLPELNDETPGELEDGRFLVDFDMPYWENSTADDITVGQKEYLGLVLCQREEEWGQSEDEADEDGALVDVGIGLEFCVMLTEEVHKEGELGDSTNGQQRYHRRVGLVWIENEHMDLLQKTRRRVLLM